VWKLKAGFDRKRSVLSVYDCDSEHSVVSGGVVVRCAVGGKLVQPCEADERMYKIDAEVILNAYLRDSGFSFIQGQSGEFCFVIHDGLTNSVYVGGDLFGVFPVFYTQEDEELFFSSDIPWIAERSSLTFDFNAIAEHLVFGAPIGGKTVFSGIGRLPMFSCLHIDGAGIIRLIALPDVGNVPNGNTHEDVIQRLAATFRSAVTERVSGHVGIWELDLTGGLDTRLIFSCVPDSELDRIRFRSMYTPPLSKSDDRDVIIALAIAERAGLELSLSEMPLAGINDLPCLLDTLLGLDEGKRVMKGLMGGELLNGDALRFIPNEVMRLLNLVGDTASREAIVERASEEGLLKWGQCQVDNLFPVGIASKCSNPVITLIDHVMNYPQGFSRTMTYAFELFVRSFMCDIYCRDTLTWACPYIFPTKVDSPFWDLRVVRLILTLPDGFLKGDSSYPIYRELFEHYFDSYNEIPTTSAFGLHKDGPLHLAAVGIDRKSIQKPNFLPKSREMPVRVLETDDDQELRLRILSGYNVWLSGQVNGGG
jgi:hypothetical protein